MDRKAQCTAGKIVYIAQTTIPLLYKFISTRHDTRYIYLTFEYDT